jgi:hypothetical protein
MLWNGYKCGKTKAMRISTQPSPREIKTDQQQSKKVEYFNYLGSEITQDARCAYKIKSSVAMTKAALKKQRAFSPANWTYE